MWITQLFNNNLFKNVLANIIAACILAILAYLFGFIDIAPKIEKIQYDISKIDSNLNDLKFCIKADKTKGKLIKVGISSDLQQNQMSCFSNNSNGFNQYDRILLRYEGNVNMSNPQVEVLVYRVEGNQNNDDRIFVSKEIASQLNIQNSLTDIYFKIIEKSKH